MSLKRSEIKNCSWIISTVLESPFCSSSCCQACFPSTIRPMNRLWEWILKIFLYSPEMNRSIVFLMYFLWMTKKLNYFLRYLIIGERMFLLVQCRSNSFFPWERCLMKSQQVLFFVVLLLPLIGIQNLSHPVLTHILRADLLEFLCRCCPNPSQTYLIHEKFWLRSEYCLCSKTKFWFQLHIYRASNWLQLPTRAQVWCSFGSILSVVMLLLLLEECVHDRPLY